MKILILLPTIVTIICFVISMFVGKDAMREITKWSEKKYWEELTSLYWAVILIISLSLYFNL